MTDNTQPEAMDLADWLEAVGGGPSAKRCAALLREQHARIAELESELEGKKKGPTAWARKAIAEQKKGKRVVLVYPIDKWVLMLLAAGAEVRNLGDVKWLATEDGSQGKGTGRHIACFILNPKDPS